MWFRWSDTLISSFVKDVFPGTDVSLKDVLGSTCKCQTVEKSILRWTSKVYFPNREINCKDCLFLFLFLFYLFIIKIAVQSPHRTFLNFNQTNMKCPPLHFLRWKVLKIVLRCYKNMGHMERVAMMADKVSKDFWPNDKFQGIFYKKDISVWMTSMAVRLGLLCCPWRPHQKNSIGQFIFYTFSLCFWFV